MNNTVTLRLNGDVPLADFAKAVEKLNAIVRALSAEVAAGSDIDWVVSGLEFSSAVATVQGTASEPDAVARVVGAYANVGHALETGTVIPYSKPAREAARALASIAHGRIDTVDFETADSYATVRARPRLTVVRAPAERLSFGGISGRIQTLTNRGSLRFTLYDLLYDRAVSCYLTEGREAIMRDAWGKLAVVEGLVRRDPLTGRPTTIRQVASVKLRPEGEPNDFLSARAISPSVTGLSPEDAIRRLRDA
jgi:hypothetical protein